MRMSWFGVAIALVVAGASPSHAQLSGAKATDPSLQAAIEARQNAINMRNAAEWEKYTAAEFVNVSADGEILSRESRLKAQTSGPPVQKNPTVIDSVRMFGADTAVSIQHSGQTNNRITIVWVRQGGTWKAVSSHTSAIKGK